MGGEKKSSFGTGRTGADRSRWLCNCQHDHSQLCRGKITQLVFFHLPGMKVNILSHYWAGGKNSREKKRAMHVKLVQNPRPEEAELLSSTTDHPQARLDNLLIALQHPHTGTR